MASDSSSGPMRPTPAVLTTSGAPTPTPTKPRSRTNSLRSLAEAPPLGMWAATGHAIGNAEASIYANRERVNSSSSSLSSQGRPRRSSTAGSGKSMSSARMKSGGSGWSGSLRSMSGRSGNGGSKDVLSPPVEPIMERKSEDVRRSLNPSRKHDADEEDRHEGIDARDSEEDEPEPGPGCWANTQTGLIAFWHWFLTPLGFFITIYMLNVVAWGGMLFLLLCNASPAMCKPSCNDLYSPRRIWIEIDSQILNSLFCVTGFGLVPWRFRDFYYLMKWRLFHRDAAYTRLQEIHANWYRPGLRQEVIRVEQGESAAPEGNVVIRPWGQPAGREGSIHGTPDVPFPTETGKRAPPTGTWKLDFVIWAYVWNTFFQICLSTFMWSMNRFDRPSWSTGFFVACACIVAAGGGIMVWLESRKVKRVEGEPPAEKAAEKSSVGEDGTLGKGVSGGDEEVVGSSGKESSCEEEGSGLGTKEKILKKVRHEKTEGPFTGVDGVYGETAAPR